MFLFTFYIRVQNFSNIEAIIEKLSQKFDEPFKNHCHDLCLEIKVTPEHCIVLALNIAIAVDTNSK